MRSAEQIGRTVGQWHDYQRAQRERTLTELLADLRRARDRNDPWLLWIEARISGEHLHGWNDEKGKRLALVPSLAVTTNAARRTLTARL